MYQRGKKVVSAISGNTTSSAPCALARCISAMSRSTTAARFSSRAIGPSCAHAIVRYLDIGFSSRLMSPAGEAASGRLAHHERRQEPRGIGKIRHAHGLVGIVAAVLVADENHIGGHAEIGEDGGIVAGPACHLDGG